MKWLAQKTIYKDSVDLLLIVRQVQDRVSVALPIELLVKDQEVNALIERPTLSLPSQSAQSLLQALWDAGLRPNDGAGSGAEAQALRQHIAFAERIADGLLVRTKP